ncbi:hypothetical protein BH23VER1_BH23VER1_21390 [soil metagenome]
MLAPSAVLAVLALRAQDQQEWVIARQRTIVHQGTVDALADEVRVYMTEQQAGFRAAVDGILEGGHLPAIEQFDSRLRATWPLERVGFALSDGVPVALGLSDQDTDETTAHFLISNSAFLAGEETDDLYLWAEPSERKIDELSGLVGRANLSDLGDSLQRGDDAQITGAPEEVESFDRFRSEQATKQRIKQNAFYKTQSSESPIQAGAEIREAKAREAKAPPDGGGDVPPNALGGSVAQESLEAQAEVESEEAAPDGARTLGMTTTFTRREQDDRRELIEELSEELAELSPSEDSSAASPEPEVAAVPQRQLERRLGEEEAANVPTPQAATPAAYSAATPAAPPAATPAATPAAPPGATPAAQAANDGIAPTEAEVRQDYRQTVPEKPAQPPHEKLLANLKKHRTTFPPVVGEAPSGSVARFVEGGALSILFWYRPSAAEGKVFGAELDLPALKDALAGAVAVEFESPDEVCVALLEHQGEPVGLSRAGFRADDWSRPFVASEIGELLPRWEVAAYLLDPGAFGVAARASRLRLGLLVAAVFAAIGCGGVIIVADARRRSREVRQKSDFVSNVSHELKTPLTSIRMFSELLAGGDSDADPKRVRYAGVIRDEAARLTRLINNVLDFSRLERGSRQFARHPVDVPALVGETVEHYAPQLRRAGCQIETEISVAGEAGLIQGDRDGISQVVVNLLSNVEKYGAGGGQVRVAVEPRSGGGVAIRVSDRGPGVPRGCEKRIFERFYRADNSLDCGVAGSGLGLTLARQIVEAHGGSVRYERREGGGSTFVVELGK